MPLNQKFNNRNLKDLLITIIYLFGGFSTIWIYILLRKTLVFGWLVLLLWFLIGFVCIPFSKKYILNYYPNSTATNINVFSIVGIGSLIISFLLTVNRYIPLDFDTRIVEVEYFDSGYGLKGRMSQCRRPFVKAKIGLYSKKLYFDCSLIVEHYDVVTLRLKRGLLGIEFIEDYYLNTKNKD